SEQIDLSQFNTDLIRSFSIIAHIDHGKSTLSDRLLELTNTIPSFSASERAEDEDDNAVTKRRLKLGGDGDDQIKNRQVLDQLKVERQRGITVKAVAVSMFYKSSKTGQRYLLNLIDTPGHVDFTTEVLRSLSVSKGVILLVDSTQGVEAQTLSVLEAAKRKRLRILPVLNKIDLPSSEPERVSNQVKNLLGLSSSKSNTLKCDGGGEEDVKILKISAKTGDGVEEVLESLIENIPSADGDRSEPMRAFVFDSWFDHFQGVVSLVSLVDGCLKKGDRIKSFKTGKTFQVMDCGIMYPKQISMKSGLYAGQCGWLTCSMKDVREAILGDTFYLASTNPEKVKPIKQTIETRQSMVYAGLYPVDSNGFEKLDDAIQRLVLNDRSVSVNKESSVALGQGFRLGFLGTLHMDVFRQRLSDEYDSEVIITRPFVPIKLIKRGESRFIEKPIDFPSIKERSDRVQILERVVYATIVVPDRYTGAVIELCSSHRGEQLSFDYVSSRSKASEEEDLSDESEEALEDEVDEENRKWVKLLYRIPLSEIVTNFHSQLKSITSGYGSFDYEIRGDEDEFIESDLVRIDFIINKSSPIDAFATIVHRDGSLREAKIILSRLKSVINKQQFEVSLQALIGNKIIASERIKAVRKDVTAGLYGGHYERKMKHLQKQKEGKKKLKLMSIGKVEIPQEAFSVVKLLLIFLSLVAILNKHIKMP
ncbi:GTP-binding protein lepa, partial [Phakopsora pachyrhizi]